MFGFLGWYLDEKLGISPFLLIGGVMLGFTGGMISLVRKVPPVQGGRTRAGGPSDASPADPPEDPTP